MHIHPSQPAPVQVVRVDKRNHFIVFDHGQRRQGLQQNQDVIAPRQMPAAQLAGDEGMGVHLTGLEAVREMGMLPPEMIDPD